MKYCWAMRATVLCLASLVPLWVTAATFDLPPPEFDLVGAAEMVEALPEDTLLDVARRHDIGQEEIVRANPGVDRWLPGDGVNIIIPSRRILPPPPREGLVLNLPEMRLYFFPEQQPGQTARVQTYPVSIGRMDWATPLGHTTLVAKERDPAWRPPESIRREHAEDGDPLPDVVPPGPLNPLGRYALRLGLPGYLIHGTNKAFGVGMRVSHGCIRMLPEDIESLFPDIPVGTPVRIINQPAKAGWYGGELYLEIHPPLEEDQVSRDALVEIVMAAIDEALLKRAARVSEREIEQAISRQDGLPVVVSKE
ncbi:MAG: L,D-transpeptidase family protein [Halioglobus sp.]